MVGTDKGDDLSMRLTGHRLPLLMDPVSSCNTLEAEHLCETQIGLLRKGPACLEAVGRSEGVAANRCNLVCAENASLL